MGKEGCRYSVSVNSSNNSDTRRDVSLTLGFLNQYFGTSVGCQVVDGNVVVTVVCSGGNCLKALLPKFLSDMNTVTIIDPACKKD